MFKKRFFSILITILLITSSFSTVMAADGDIRLPGSDEVITPLEYLFDVSLFFQIAQNIENYEVEVAGAFYNAGAVNEQFNNGATNFQEAIEGMDEITATYSVGNPVFGQYPVTITLSESVQESSVTSVTIDGSESSGYSVDGATIQAVATELPTTVTIVVNGTTIICTTDEENSELQVVDIY